MIPMNKCNNNINTFFVNHKKDIAHMSTDNLYLHTFSIRGSTCAPCSPYSFTDLLHQRRRTVHCISSTCWYLESPQRIYNVFEVSVPGQFISTLFSYYLFQLHKTSHVASASCQNAYIMDHHDQSRWPSFLGGPPPLANSCLDI